MNDFPHDPARPFVVVKEWPGGRKEARQFSDEWEASRRAMVQAGRACRGTTIHLCYSGEPQRVIQQWKGGHCPGCGMADENCLCVVCNWCSQAICRCDRSAFELDEAPKAQPAEPDYAEFLSQGLTAAGLPQRDALVEHCKQVARLDQQLQAALDKPTWREKCQEINVKIDDRLKRLAAAMGAK